MRRLILSVVIANITGAAGAQADLRGKIQAIAKTAQGRVSVACALPGVKLNCDLNADAHPPMQSVFKLPLGMAVLDAVERGRFGDGRRTLDQMIRFRAADREPKTYSPLQDKYPAAEVDVPLRELLRLTVSLSDNVAADLLLRLVGGTAVVQRYMDHLGVQGFHLEDNEATLHREVMAQYRNWFSPAAAVSLLRTLSDRSPLNTEHTALVRQWMLDSPNKTRLRGLLPAGVQVFQKTGTSDVSPEGLAYATNDIGLIVLPDGRQLAVAVFVTDSPAPDATRDAVIAQITRAIYDAALIPAK